MLCVGGCWCGAGGGWRQRGAGLRVDGGVAVGIRRNGEVLVGEAWYVTGFVVDGGRVDGAIVEDCRRACVVVVVVVDGDSCG